MKRPFLFLVILILGTNILYPQNNTISNITVNKISEANQIPSNTVHRMIQDSDGYLWFGTAEGLCRYDAYSIKVFRSDIHNSNLLSSNEITCLAEDKDKNIWFGTKSGLNILNRETFKIRSFDYKGITGEHIRSVYVTSNGDVWIGASSQLFRYRRKDHKLEVLTPKYFPSGAVNSVYEDKFGETWIAIWGRGLYKLKKDGSIVHYEGSPQNSVVNPFKIFQDSNNQYWVCSWGGGLYRFYPNASPEDMFVECKIVKDASGAFEKTFFGIVEDDVRGYIWVMSLSGIHALENGADGKVRQIDVANLFSKSNRIYSDLIKDKKGNLWVATFGEGVFTVNFDKPVVENLDLETIRKTLGATPNITRIYEDKDGLLWLNQNRYGLCFYDPKQGAVKTYKEIQSLASIDWMDNIGAIKPYGDTEVWIGLYDASFLAIIEKRQGGLFVKKTVDLEAIKAGLGGIRSMYHDSKNNMWVATVYGLFVKRSGSDAVECVSDKISYITEITEDINGQIWLSTESNGIYRIDSNLQAGKMVISAKNFRKESDGLLSNQITSIHSGNDGLLWLGSNDGYVFTYDASLRKSEDYTKRSQLKGEAILNMVTDRFNKLWILTNKRIVEYQAQLNISRDYTTTDGIIVNSFLKDSYYLNTAKNTIYFGGNRGVAVLSTTSHSLGSQLVGKRANNVLVTDLKLLGYSVLTGSEEQSKFGAVSQKLRLSPSDKNFEIDFSSLNYTYPEKVMYAYKMQGVDDDWIYTNRQFATYTQLGKGKHTFLVKATDENRIWSDEVTVVEIYKAPAFYETWWAYLLYVVIVLAIAYALGRVTLNRIKLKNDLRIAQIEKDNAEELTQTKLRYFTNISHDFLTPLTIISCLIDDAEELINKKVPQFEAMRKNVNRLNRLLQQVIDFRKMESGNLKLKVSKGDVVAFVKDVCYNNFLPLIEKKKIKFSFDADSSQILGYFDADKVDKIIHNLMSNAVKYTDDEGEISVGLSTFQNKGLVYLHVEIADTGIGIYPEDLENIFTRFYYNRHVDASKTNGIGLSLTRDLVELHHGHIGVKSEVDKGSVFSVDIPIDEKAYRVEEYNEYTPIIDISSDIIQDVAEVSDEYMDNESNTPREKFNLLLIEDNEDILYTMKNILQKRYNVYAAVNGKVGYDIIQNNDIDIVVSDVMMPEMDGLELCRAIKSNIETSHISVILLTAKSSVEDRIECYDAGADGYIAKPFELKVLEARINNFLSHKKDKQKEFKSNVEINIGTLEYPLLDEQFLNNVIQLIETHLSDSNFDISFFADQMHMSKSSLYRKLKTMTGLTPVEFIRNIRLKHACQMLGNSNITISEVAYTVGFTDPRYFGTCFKNEFGMTPGEYQKRHTRAK